MVIVPYSDQKLSPESKRLHVLKKTSNNLNCHDQTVTDNSETSECNKTVDDIVQQHKRVKFQEPDGSCREVVVGQYICDVLEQNKQELSPKGTLFVYLRSQFGE